MLEKNPKERISAKDALAHPWFMMEFDINNSGSITKDKAKLLLSKKYSNLKDIMEKFHNSTKNFSELSFLSSKQKNNEFSRRMILYKEKTKLSSKQLVEEEFNFNEEEISERVHEPSDRYSSKALPLHMELNNSSISQESSISKESQVLFTISPNSELIIN